MSLCAHPFKVSAGVSRLRIPPTKRPSKWRENVWQMLLAGVLVSIVMFTQGCGGGSSSSSGVAETPGPTPAPQQMGEVAITLTDAEADFVSYTVGVVSLTMTKANGDVVETIPLATRVDFNELTEVTEFFTIATVPAGNYVAVSMVLDYANHDVWVEDAMGDAVKADVVDLDGNAIATMALDVLLPASDVIRIRPGIPAAVSVDFDLEASNTVDTAVSPPLVTVEPWLLVHPELERDREHRVRGAVAGVNEEESSITLKVRPFRHRHQDFGRFTFFTNDETVCEINEQEFVGSECLTALALEPLNTPLVAGGTINDARQFVAFKFLAGTSVPWADDEVVHGVVAARSGDTLTVKGARIDFADGADAFRGEFWVLLGENTVVKSILVDNERLNKDSISVGQRITAFGELTADGTLDASEGTVRMRVSSLTGEVVQSLPLVVDLRTLNGRNPGVYDFAGTGVTPADDADPANYEVDTGALSLPTIEPLDLVRVRGNVNAWNMAPADFLAQTVIDVNTDLRRARFGASWAHIGGTQTALTLDPARVLVDLRQARHVLKLLGVRMGVDDPIDEIALIAPQQGGVWGVAVRGGGEMHILRDFADLVVELNEQLDAGNLLVRIGASGSYNGASNELTSGRAIFVFIEPSEE